MEDWNKTFDNLYVTLAALAKEDAERRAATALIPDINFRKAGDEEWSYGGKALDDVIDCIAENYLEDLRQGVVFEITDGSQNYNFGLQKK